jgi:hypothetical protein
MQRLPVVVSLLLSFAALLLVLSRSPIPTASGQAVGEAAGRFIMATAVYQNGTRSMVYVLDVVDKKLASYSTDGVGIEYQGTREITWDLKPEQLDPSGRRLSVAEIKKAAK